MPVVLATEQSAKNVPTDERLTLTDLTPTLANKELAKPVIRQLDSDTTEHLISMLPPLPAQAKSERAEVVRVPKASGVPVQNRVLGNSNAAIDVPTKEALSVVRYSPEGEVSETRQVTVVFSQPMVPFSSQSELNKYPVPVRITPDVPGQWRWLGTQTATFMPDAGRFPAASTFTVRVNGAQALNGAILERDCLWAFSTARPEVAEVQILQYPEGSRDGKRSGTIVDANLNPRIHVVFKQRVSPASVLAKSVLVCKGVSYPLKINSSTVDKEVGNDEDGEQAITRHDVVLMPVSKLPPHQTFQFKVAPGIVSEEGARTSVTGKTKSFCTFPNFTVKKITREDFVTRITFSNEFDRTFPEDKLLMWQTPAPAVTVTESFSSIVVSPGKLIRGRYKAKINPELRDIYGQKLASPHDISIDLKYTRSGFLNSQRQCVLRASDPGFFPIRSVNMREFDVRVYKLDEYQLKQYLCKPEIIGNAQLVYQRRVKPENLIDRISSTGLDITQITKGNPANLLLVASGRSEEGHKTEFVSLLNVTDIVMDVHSSRAGLLCTVSRLEDGRPANNVDVSMYGDKGKLLFRHRANDDGMVVLPREQPGQTVFLIASSNGHNACVDLEDDLASEFPKYTWFATSDRGLYRPGERVYVKGWLRAVKPVPRQFPLIPPVQVKKVSWKFFDRQHSELASGQTSVNSTGGFDFSAQIPRDCALGSGYFTLEAADGASSAEDGERVELSIQEFVRPQFVFSLSSDNEKHFAGDMHKVKLKASYYSGEPLPRATVRWSVSARPNWSSFAPPTWSHYSFGTHRYWGNYDQNESLDLTTDQSGESQLGINFQPPDHFPHQIVAEAVVTDVNKRSWTSRTSMLVHPASVCVGLRWKKTSAESNSAQVEIVTCDLDGHLVPGKNVSLKVSRREQSQVKNSVIVDEKSVVVAEGAAVSDIRFVGSGWYQISASAADDRGRVTESVLDFFLTPSSFVTEPVTLTDYPVDEGLSLKVTGENCEGTQRSVEIEVSSQVFPRDGNLIIATPAQIFYRPIKLTSKVTAVTVPFDDSFYPVTQLAIALAPELGKNFALVDDNRFASCEFEPGKIARSLVIHPVLEKTAIRPGQENLLTFKVTDTSGKAISDCDAAVIVVDESLLALRKHEFPDPLEKLFQRVAGSNGPLWSVATRNNFVHFSRADLTAGAGEATWPRGWGFGGGGGGGEMACAGSPAPNLPPPPVEIPEVQSYEPGEIDVFFGRERSKSPVRKNFQSLAYFKGSATTDAAGLGTVRFTVPDNLTKYRVILIAGSIDGKFGQTETGFVVNAPFNIRQAPPRFVRAGDRVELPLVVQNNSDAPVDVSLAARAHGLKLGRFGIKTEVPAHDRVEITLPAACEEPGGATLQVVGSTPDFIDGVEFSFPVKPPDTKESFAVDGIVEDRPVQQRLSLPNKVASGGSLTVTTSASAVSKLEAAHDYLQTYSFECSEQLASKILSTLCRDGFAGNMNESGQRTRSSIQINHAIRQLINRQLINGGFGVWSNVDQENEYVNAHVLHALIRASQQGTVVPAKVLENAVEHIASVRPPAASGAENNSAGAQIFAYGQYVLNLTNKANSGAVISWLKNGDRVESADLDVLAWCLPVVAKKKDSQTLREKIRRRLFASLNETTGTASVQNVSACSWQTFGSTTRTNALILAAMIADCRDSDIIPKLAASLIDRRKNGRWANTQENVFAILALSAYFKAFEKVPPDFLATVWLNDKLIDSAKFVGRGALSQETVVPVEELVDGKDRTLLIDKSGAGRLYYRMLLSYSSGDSVVLPMDRGFGIRRVYESVDNPKDVERLDDGSWLIKRGAIVRVVVTCWNSGTRHNVALIDPLPGGLEAINFKLNGEMFQVSRRKPDHAQSLCVRHENFRDDRIEVIADTVEPGAFVYSYYARALTGGEFTAAPTYVEEMYRPETFGRSGSDRVKVVD